MNEDVMVIEELLNFCRGTRLLIFNQGVLVRKKLLLNCKITHSLTLRPITEISY